jgi:hypothetical protein
VNAHELTNAARAAVYGLSTRTGARRARIGRRLSVDDRRFDGRFGVPVHTFAWAEAQQGAMPGESMVCHRGRSHAVDWSARAAIGSSGVRRAGGSRPLRIRCGPSTSVRAREHLVVLACPTARRAVV